MSNLVNDTFAAITKNQNLSNSPVESLIGELLVTSLTFLNAEHATVNIYQVGLIKVDIQTRQFQFQESKNENMFDIVNNSKTHKNNTTKKIINKSLFVPISYASKKLGCLIIYLSQAPLKPGYKKFTGMLANKLKLIIMRHRIRCITKHNFDKEIFLIGHSESSLKLELMIERASDSMLPVVLSGEVGSEFLHVACAIHYSSQLADEPFIEINCSTLASGCIEADPEKWFELAKGGTLFLNQIDQLDQIKQQKLSVFIDPLTSQRLGSLTRFGSPKTRIIVSTTQDLTKLVKVKKFAYNLYAEINFLRIPLPPLRNRGHDIVYQIEHFLSMHSKHEKKTLSQRALSSLTQYSWPGNYTELQQVIAHLSTMNLDGQICFTDIEQFAPYCLEQDVSDNVIPAKTKTTKTMTCKNQNVESNNQILALKLLVNECAFLKSLHPSLCKALVYIKDNYHEHLTLPVLANHSCVSPSHLCFLFRTELDTTFKSLLGTIRIEQAKQLLSADSNDAITKISLDVGFRDLSHFERTFRRLVGLNPREYKRIIGGQAITETKSEAFILDNDSHQPNAA